MRNKQRQLHR